MRNQAIGLAAALLAATSAGDPDELLGPMADQLRNRVGTWCVEARLQLTPEARPIRVDAVAESRLVGQRWLVTELRGMDGRGGFHGIGVNGYDPGRQRYSGYWIDGTRGFAIPVEGEFDPESRVFTTRSVERRADGGSVTILSETRPDGPDREITTFTAPDAQGRPYQRMLLRYSRTRAAEACTAPTAAASD